jgi:hypothetical protein
MPDQNHASFARPDLAFRNLPAFIRSRAPIGRAVRGHRAAWPSTPSALLGITTSPHVEAS